MNLLIKLAWRNIWRNKRRTLITISAVTFATMLTIIMRGIQLGTYQLNIKNVAGSVAGLLQIQKPGYKDNPSLRKSFRYSKALIKILRSEKEITGFAPRLYAEALVSSGENSFGAMIIGIEPEMETAVSQFKNKLKKGKFLNSDSTNEIIIGYKLLKNLKLNIGDSVVVLAQGYDGALWDMYFKIAGVIKTGFADIDNSALFMGLKTAQEFLSTGNRVSIVAIAIGNVKDVEDVKFKLKEKLQKLKLDVLSWDEVMPDFKQTIEFDNISGILFLLILIIIVAFGILDTLLMSITERFNEFGVNLAIGMKNGKLALLIILETVMITFIGIAVGNILGAMVNYYFIKHPITFGGELSYLYEEFGWIPKIVSLIEPGIFIKTSVTILLISLVSAIYPIYKVYKLEPLKGIRYT